MKTDLKTAVGGSLDIQNCMGEIAFSGLVRDHTDFRRQLTNYLLTTQVRLRSLTIPPSHNSNFFSQTFEAAAIVTVSDPPN